MDNLQVRRLLYKHKDDIIHDLNIDDSVCCHSCLINSCEQSCFEYCNGCCICDHDNCNECDMECHNNCPCNCDHEDCCSDIDDDEYCPVKSGDQTNLCHKYCDYVDVDNGQNIKYTILINAFKISFEIFEKYNKIFIIDKPYNFLLELCLENNFYDCTFTNKTKELQKQRFYQIINCPIDFSGELLHLTDEYEFINELIKRGCNVNYVFNDDQTYLSQLFSGLMYSESCNSAKNKIEFLLSKGADINLGNIRIISGIQYKDRPHKIEQVKYLMSKGLNIENRLLFKDKMLYDTRLGETILNILSEEPLIKSATKLC